MFIVIQVVCGFMVIHGVSGSLRFKSLTETSISCAKNSKNLAPFKYDRNIIDIHIHSNICIKIYRIHLRKISTI